MMVLQQSQESARPPCGSGDEHSVLEHALHGAMVGLRYHNLLAQVTLPLPRLGGQDMAVVGMRPFDLSCARQAESFLCSAPAFHLRHELIPLALVRLLFFPSSFFV